MSYLLGLVGNQNCGKTTLFNALTGSNQHVGNFPGVTVERKEGYIKPELLHIAAHHDYQIGRRHHGRKKPFNQRNHQNQKQPAVLVDLPGIYSLSPYTAEEIVTRDFVIKDRPDVIINILDATNLERNLYLTLQLMELNIPMVLALNMMDEVRASGNSIDIEALSSALGVPVVPISAAKNEGISELALTALRICKEKEKYLSQIKFDFCSGEIHRAIHAIAHIIEDHTTDRKIPVRFAATKLVERETQVAQVLGLDEGDIHIINHIVDNMEEAIGLDSLAALADMRYNYIEKICAQCLTKKQITKEQLRSEKIDRYLTHQVWSIPIFLGIMLTVFWLTFEVIGGPLQDLLGQAIDYGSYQLGQWLLSLGISPLLYELLINAVIAGVGSVLSFLPIIVVLFFFLSLLEDSGYMARIAFVMDKLLRKIGLSGRSFAPLLIGFGCSVPAVMASRTLPSERDRLLTISLVPFMSCSAKLPIYAMMIAAFFGTHEALILFSLYILGIVIAVIMGLILSRTLYEGDAMPFVMELPAYRMPGLMSVIRHMWEKAKEFVKKAFTVIFLATIIIWFLQTFDWGLNVVEAKDSMLASLGALIAPLFAPLGFADWRVATALITGLTAKEAVVSTLTVLLGSSADSELMFSLNSMFTPLSAYSFLVFTLLYVPCIATFAAARREMGSTWRAVRMGLIQVAVAYTVALLVYNLGRLIFNFELHLIDWLIIIILLAAIFLVIRHIHRNGTCSCGNSNCSCQKSGQKNHNCHCQDKK